MGSVPTLLSDRWTSPELVGKAAHSCLVRIRQGWVNHFHETTTILPTSPDTSPTFPTVTGSDNTTPWQGQWSVTGDWINLTNIQSATWTRDLTQNGGSVLTVVMDNIAFNDATGTGGAYHTIDRGWFSPTRGYTGEYRTEVWPSNEWTDVFNAGYQIELWEGYGVGSDVIPVWDSDTNMWSAPSASKTWVGWLDEVDLDSHPDQITLTCRDGAILLTDQRLIGQNKDPGIQSPVTFADRATTIAAGIPHNGWVLVDDAAEVVRMILLWAGFHEMEVTDFGWSLEGPMWYGMDKFFIDVINDILAQGNYLFFIDAPTDHDMSLGVPRFVPQQAVTDPPSGMLEIKDVDFIEALSIKWDKSNLPYVMRYIGAQSGTDLVESGPFAGTGLVQSYIGTYWPPWSGHDYTNLQGGGYTGGYPLERLGGVRRHFTQTNLMFKSVGECLFGCILAAIQYALQAVTGQFQIAGLPGIGLNQQVSIIDTGTGTNSRMWVASVQSQHTLGVAGNWHMTVGGSMIDTEDMDLIRADYDYTYEQYVTARG